MPAEHRDYEDVKGELARELLARESAGVESRAVAERLAAAVREGRSLEDAARAEELTLERSGWLRRRPDGFVPGLGAAQDLMATAFTLEPGESSATIYEVGDNLALVQALERNPPDPEEVEKALPDTRRQLLDQKRGAYAEAWLGRRRQQLADSGELAVNLELVRRGG